MADEFLARVDREAGASGSTRSAFLQEAARTKLGWPDAATVDAALERGRAALVGVGEFESAEVIRSQREERDERDRHRR